MKVIGGFLLLFAAIAIFYFVSRTDELPPVEENTSIEDETVVTSLAMEFGAKLKFVSLLASTENRKTAMDEYYAPYVSSELLETWYPEGAEALGGYTSSPFPSEIRIVEVRTEGPYIIVEGNVIEITNAATSTEEEVVAVYPVTLTYEKQGDKWMIVAVEKGAYSEIPHRQTIVGFWECLPHKDTSGPQTMECAFGIAVDQSDGHFAVDTRLMSTMSVDYAVGTKVRVSGVVTPANQLSGIQKYDIDGIISATTIEEVE